MSLAREVALHPELVEDVVEELLECNIIHPNEIEKLKNENRGMKYDPNMIMDFRHEQVKKRSTVITRESKMNDYRITEKTVRKIEIDYLHVDKEIEKFKKELELERKKLYKLNNSSNEKNQPSKNKQNKIVQQPFPVTNVVTQPKNKDNDRIPTGTDGTEICVTLTKKDNKIKDKPIEVNGYKPLSIMTQLMQNRCLNEQSPACPHRIINTEQTRIDQLEPSLIESKIGDKCTNGLPTPEKKTNKKHSANGQTENKSDKKHKNHFLVSKTVDKWKLFVVRQQTSRCTKQEEILRIKRRKFLLKKYWIKWFEYYKNNKQVNDEIIKKKSRMEKLNLFFEKLQEAKNNLDKRKEDMEAASQIDMNTAKQTNDQPNKKSKTVFINKSDVFVNRLKAQKNIIQEQKAKLEEQNQLIRQLKEEKLQENIKEYNKNLQFNVKETVKYCDRKLKPMAKLIANKFNIRNDNTEKLNDDYFVKRMNERAQERKEKWEIIRMRRHMIEEEKKRKQIEDEERREEEEENERRRKFHEKKEQIRLQKETESRRLQEIEQMKTKMGMAKKYFDNRLKRKVINILKKKVERKRNYERTCDFLYNRKLLKKCIMHWKQESSISARQKLITAETFYNYKLLHWCWNNWIALFNESIRKRQVSEDYYDAKLIEKSFDTWKEFTVEQFIENERKNEAVTNYYHRMLMTHCFKRWKQFPNVMRTIREEEKRIRSWRAKVLEIIPDFNPQLLVLEDDDDNNDDEK